MSTEDSTMSKHELDMAMAAVMSEKMTPRRWMCKFGEIHPSCQKVRRTSTWLSFMRFREWWTENHVDGWQLDKDLLVLNNKTYSPDACIYIPQWLNKFTVDAAAARGLLPITLRQ